MKHSLIKKLQILQKVTNLNPVYFLKGKKFARKARIFTLLQLLLSIYRDDWNGIRTWNKQIQILFNYKIIINFKITILIDIELPQILKNQNKFWNYRIFFYNFTFFFYFWRYTLNSNLLYTNSSIIYSFWQQQQINKMRKIKDW